MDAAVAGPYFSRRHGSTDTSDETLMFTATLVTAMGAPTKTSELASPELRDRMDQLASVAGGEPAGKSRAGPVLDLFLYQLIRYRHFGEGEYEQSKRVIQKLLIEAGARGIGRNLVSVIPQGAEAPADWDNVKSPETYVGSERSENRVSPDSRLRLNQWTLAGDWRVQKQAAVLKEANGRIVYRFHARDLNLVMAPGVGGKPVPFRVLIDAQRR